MSARSGTKTTGLIQHQFDLNLPPGIRVVTEPTMVESTTRGGTYTAILTKALRLEPTSVETGLSPHLEWNCESADEMKKRISGLMAAKRRNKREYGRLCFMQRSNEYTKKFVIYIWKEV